MAIAIVQIITFVGRVNCIGDSAHGMHVLSHVPNLAGKLACTCSLIFEELELAISRSQKMSALEIESMTAEEVGEWLKKK